MPLRQTPTLRRVCVARFGAIGDLLMTTPTLRALTRFAPGVEIDYIVGKGLGEVLSGLPYVRRVIEFDKKADAKPARLLAFARNLRRERYDLFLNLQRSVKTVLFAMGSGAPRVLTYQRRRAPLPGTNRLQHTVDNFLDTLAPLGINGAAADRHLDFFIPDAARERVNVLLGEAGIGPREPLVVVNPGVSDLVRRWPIAHIAAFFDEMAARRPDVRLALCGAPGGDMETARAILAQTKTTTVVNLAGRTSFKETGALLARANVFVTGDTGPMHLAAAIGTPLVALFGPTDPHRTGPMSPPGRALVLVQNAGLPCVPCRSHTCARGDNACMVRQTPEQVIAAVERHLQTVEGAVA